MDESARLVVSLLASDEQRRLQAIEGLAGELGPLVSLSRPLAFVHGGYYNQEMGTALPARSPRFMRLVKPENLERIKRRCMDLERQLVLGGGRTVNIDPGLLGSGSLVLATHKPAPHRTPLGQGLYCELTLFFHQGRFQPQVWTYQDYASEEIIQILTLLRQRYLWQLRHLGSGNKEPDQ